MTTYYLDPAVGNDSNDGSDWGASYAWATLQKAADTAQAGDIVYCRGTETISAQVDFDTYGGTYTAGFIKFIGCNGSGVVDGTRYIVDANNANIHGISLAVSTIWFQNFEVKRTGTQNGFRRTGGWTHYFINCCANNCSTGFSLPSTSNSLFYKCVAYANSTGFYVDGTSNQTIFCCSRDNTDYNHNYGIGLYYCISYDGGVATINNAATGLLFCSSIDGIGSSGDGITLTSTSSSSQHFTMLGCRVTNFSTSGKIGLNCVNRPAIVGYCYFENNDGDNIQNTNVLEILVDLDGNTTNIEDQSDTDQGYVDPNSEGSEDYNLRSDATLRRVAIAIPTS